MAVRPGNQTPAAVHHPVRQTPGIDAAAESARLRQLLLPAVEGHGLFLEDVEIRIAGAHRTVNVIVDLTEDHQGSVSLDVISEVSLDISQLMDTDPHDDGRPYSLEVSSPGVSRPLLEPRHWKRNTGRLVAVKLVDGGELEGRLLGVDDSGITLRPLIPVKKGMKPKHGEERHLAFDAIRKGTVQVEFAHLDDVDASPEHLPAEEA
ncbi:ribosome maturation factor RimP [Arthrobacter sp. H5]|uniref:ribosome maturation factor RimP n=1 Tax=Arthrobacter sp. H5 TaxID=1267973 RepID=UPI0004B7FC56|nr:ribosome maturation factor RimP [Arthrobacter sp. H5]